MPWTVIVDINLVRQAEREGGGERLRLVALKRLLEIDGPEALGAAPAPSGSQAPVVRHLSVSMGGRIMFARLEILPARTVIVRSAWSFARPDWF